MTSAGEDQPLIRLARPRDVPAIARFADVVVHEVYDPLIGAEAAERMLPWWGEPLTDAVGQGLVYVAVAAGDVVGLVETGDCEGEPVIWKLYVAADRRSGGIGARLMQVAIASIEPGHDRVLIEHVSTNERAGRFYDREGFPVIRHAPSDDPEDDIVWRARRLGDGTDDYSASAEFHEIHMDAVWAELGDPIAETFGDVPAEGVIVDIGAGSGAGVVAVAAHTSCEIAAIEPSPTMRAMLLVRLAAMGLTDRVTVIPSAAPAGLAAVPDRVDGVVGGHMLGHLGSDDRTTVFDWVADHVVDGGAALFTVSGDGAVEPDAVAVEEHRVGRHTYRATHHSPDATTYESLFEVVADGRVVRSAVVTGRWERVTAADIGATVGDRLEVIEPRPGVVVLRRPPPDTGRSPAR